MKKLFTLLTAVLCLLTACSQQPASPGESLSADKSIYFIPTAARIAMMRWIIWTGIILI